MFDTRIRDTSPGRGFAGYVSLCAWELKSYHAFPSVTFAQNNEFTRRMSHDRRYIRSTPSYIEWRSWHAFSFNFRKTSFRPLRFRLQSRSRYMRDIRATHDIDVVAAAAAASGRPQPRIASRNARNAREMTPDNGRRCETTDVNVSTHTEIRGSARRKAGDYAPRLSPLRSIWQRRLIKLKLRL